MSAQLTGKLSPYKRFLELLASEKRVIGYIYIYALFSGLINLSLPLGIQSLIGFVSGGQLVTSVTILIIFIIIGVLLVGGLQVMQLSLVEHIQQRLFAIKAFQFSSHLIQIQGKEIKVNNLPELMNRFFDVISLQKGLAKMLTDFSAAAIQIIFGLILLSLYHPYFIFFGLMLIVMLVLILRLTGPKGMKTSLEESKYKYQLVHWLEEVARHILVFKTTGNHTLALEKTDFYTSGYLKARKAHFKVLITQYIGFVGFKTLITASLLLIGSLLLVNQEINLGQFVASEIIIILIINAVEKLLVKLDAVYDVLTSVEKLGTVTDLPMEEPNGLVMEHTTGLGGVSLHLKDVMYRYSNSAKHALQGISLIVAPAEKICLTGNEQAGSSTLLQILAGILPDYEGVVAYNGLSLRDHHRAGLQKQMGICLLPGNLFEGTVLENITMGQPEVKLEDVLWALQFVDLSDFVQSLPEGLQTGISSHKRHISEGIAQQLALARSIVRQPKMLLLDDFLPAVDKKHRDQLIHRLLHPQMPWTVIIASNDPTIMQACNRIIGLENGRIVSQVKGTASANDELLLNQ